MNFKLNFKDDINPNNKRPRIKLAMFAVVFASLSSGFYAHAQVAGDGPVQVTANEIDVQPANNMAIFSGNAEVVQNNSVLRSTRFRVFYKGENSNAAGQVDKVVSDSEVFFVTPTEQVRGDRATYDGNTRVVTFSGNVILTQGQNVVTGEELRINTLTRQSVMRSAGGRVKAVFFNQQAPKK